MTEHRMAFISVIGHRNLQTAVISDSITMASNLRTESILISFQAAKHWQLEYILQRQHCHYSRDSKQIKKFSAINLETHKKIIFLKNSRSIILHVANSILIIPYWSVQMSSSLCMKDSQWQEISKTTLVKWEIEKTGRENEDLRFWKDTVFKKVAIFCYSFSKDILQYPLQFTI